MASIETKIALFNHEIKVKDAYEKNKTSEYKESILYQRDVLSNEKILSDLNKQIQNIYLETHRVSVKCESKGTTKIKERASAISGYAAWLSDSNRVIQKILTDIEEKSILVFQEKNEEYETNMKKIHDINQEYLNCVRRYQDAERERNSAMSQMSNNTLLDTERSNLNNKINSCKNKMENCVDNISSLVEHFKNINDMNTNLIEQYIGKIV